MLTKPMMNVQKRIRIPKVNPKVLQASILLYFAAILPLSAVHELGHWLACTSAGHESAIGFTLRGAWTACSPDLNTNLFNIAGPSLGTVASAAIIFAGFRFRKAAIGISLLVVGYAFAVDQTSKIIFEGIFTQAYVSGAFDVLITGIQITSLLGFMILFSRIKSVSK